VLDEILSKQATFPGKILAGEIKVDGCKGKFLEMMSCLEPPDFWFNIVTP
jgi:alkyl sulfatase BDS1-like metallo-beta-lactamase superfamily hydrolase